MAGLSRTSPRVANASATADQSRMDSGHVRARVGNGQRLGGTGSWRKGNIAVGVSP